MKQISIYIHYPFCVSKCPYCDFNSYRLLDLDKIDFLKAYILEIKYYSKLLEGRVVDTIFFGGGTPSIVEANFIGSILENIYNFFNVNKNVEITIEANPTTFEIKKFQEFKSIGINRLSIGIQSLNNKYLKFFGRTHDRSEAIKAINIAQKCFDDNYSIDLIYARLNQTIKDWLKELNEALNLSSNHISLYQLIVEKGTKFYENKIKQLNDNKAIKLYNITNDFLESRGIFMYEVSNYAKNGFECKHNLNYWSSGEWIGIGAGAHGRLCFNSDGFFCNYKIRTAIENIKDPIKWQNNVLKYGNGSHISEKLSKYEFIEELLIMGLRMREGINLKNIKKYLNIKNIYEILNKNYISLEKNNYIEISEKILKIPLNNFCLLDSIIEKLI